jgi:hypothetical protein
MAANEGFAAIAFRQLVNGAYALILQPFRRPITIL